MYTRLTVVFGIIALVLGVGVAATLHVRAADDTQQLQHELQEKRAELQEKRALLEKYTRQLKEVPAPRAQVSVPEEMADDVSASVEELARDRAQYERNGPKRALALSAQVTAKRKMTRMLARFEAALHRLRDMHERLAERSGVENDEAPEAMTVLMNKAGDRIYNARVKTAAAARAAMPALSSMAPQKAFADVSALCRSAKADMQKALVQLGDVLEMARQ